MSTKGTKKINEAACKRIAIVPKPQEFKAGFEHYSKVGRNKLIRAAARISVSGKNLSMPETPPRAMRHSALLRRALDGLIPAYLASRK
ncbi:MAG: hypothetical protein ACXWE4_01500 [Methylobacter sp.]